MPRATELRDAEMRTYRESRVNQAVSEPVLGAMQGQAANQPRGVYQQHPSQRNAIKTPTACVEQESEIDKFIAENANLVTATHSQMEADKRFATSSSTYSLQSAGLSVPSSKAPQATVGGTSTNPSSTSERSDASALDRPIAPKPMRLPMDIEARINRTHPDLRRVETPVNRQAPSAKPSPGILESPLELRPPSRPSSLFPRFMGSLSENKEKAQANVNTCRETARRADMESNTHPQDTNKPQNQKYSRAPAQELIPSPLQEALHVDQDLKDWLQITGYWDNTIKEEMLRNRREIRELDNRKNKLVAEMEANKYAPILLAPESPGCAAPVHSQAVTSVKRENYNSAIPRHQEAAIKRSYTDAEELRQVDGPKKFPRLEERSNRRWDSYRPARDNPDYNRYGQFNWPRRYNSPQRGRSRSPSCGPSLDRGSYNRRWPSPRRTQFDHRWPSPRRTQYDPRWPSPRRTQHDTYNRDNRKSLPISPHGNGNGWHGQYNTNNRDSRQFPPTGTCGNGNGWHSQYNSNNRDHRQRLPPTGPPSNGTRWPSPRRTQYDTPDRNDQQPPTGPRGNRTRWPSPRPTQYDTPDRNGQQPPPASPSGKGKRCQDKQDNSTSGGEGQESESPSPDKAPSPPAGANSQRGGFNKPRRRGKWRGKGNKGRGGKA
jgi:hypothetical protein